MAILVMLYGQSGTGKSTSLRNFGTEEVAIINVSGKPLPFRSTLQTYSSNVYMDIIKAIQTAPQPSIVIDDATYLMVDELMANVNERGFDKFTKMAKNFSDLIEITRKLPENKIIYFIGHSDQADDGREHFKTVGKMIDNYITLEGKFSIVLKTVVNDGNYYFTTQNSGNDTVKTPIDMFQDVLIPNDLKNVDDVIREYYGLEVKNG